MPVEFLRHDDGRMFSAINLSEPTMYWYDKKVLVSGIGHSGTNVFTELVRASGAFDFINFGSNVEDRMSWCLPNSGALLVLTENYGSKMACEAPYFNIVEFLANMERFPNLHVLLCLRHPVDTVLSGIYRSLPESMGGDSLEIKEEDVRIDKKYIDNAVQMWQRVHLPMMLNMLYRYGDTLRVVPIKLEALIESPTNVAKNIATWLKIPYKEEMANPWNKVRHAGQVKRYEGKIDRSQIYTHQRWEELYGGFFADKGDLVCRLIDGLENICSQLDYEVEQC